MTRRTLFLLCGFLTPAFAQPEVMAWGNLTGIRVNGHLLEFGTGVCVVQPDWTAVSRTDKERQTTSYSRNGGTATVNLQMKPPRALRDSEGASWIVSASEVIEDAGPATARINVEIKPSADAKIAGAYFCLDLPAAFYSGGSVELIGNAAQASLAPGAAEQNEYLRTTATGARFLSPKRQLEVTFSEPTEIIIRDDRRKGNYDLRVYLGVPSGKRAFTIKASGELDATPLTIALDAARPGQIFDGLGGNFRLQNPKLDPQVSQYNLDNLRLAWARVELPWRLWHPDEEVNPLDAARVGKLNPRVHDAMDMARRLARKGMPVIVSAWTAPNWAILGDPRDANRQEDPRGNPLNPGKMTRIKESLASYLVFLKERYGVEAAMFSFNESDLGINIRQTPREHAELIRMLGAHMASQGLATKMLLGDTSDARPVAFVAEALRDPEAVKYVGAVSFHSWRGCTDEILAAWRDVARQINVPLLVGEGSTDAAAWRYPRIFSEQSFALYEINLYIRILALAQPKSILQWQMTSDYSLLTGGGVFGDNGPLRPTQRFWNLKQLASTPPNSFALPVTCNKPGIACAAMGDIANGLYTLHIVNNGGARPATLDGLPAGVKELRVWVTDATRGMRESAHLPVTDGKAELMLDATSFTTLVSAQ